MSKQRSLSRGSRIGDGVQSTSDGWWSEGSRLVAKEVAVAKCRVGARRPRAHVVPHTQREHVVELAAVCETASERAPAIDGQRRYAAVELHTLSPRPRELAAKKPARGDVLARQKALHFGKGRERPLEGGKLSRRCRRALPRATTIGAHATTLCKEGGGVGERCTLCEREE